jgi:aminopeptidase N
MIFFYGRETLKEGLKTYFDKYSFKNTVLSDFVTELANAAVKVGAVESAADMINWSESWLKTAGCA